GERLTMTLNDTFNITDCPNLESDYEISYRRFRVTVDVFIVGFLCIFGILGNIISMCVIKSGKIAPARTTTFLLQCLSVSDSCYLVMAFLSSSLRGIWKYTDWGDPFYGNYPYMYRYIWALSAIGRLLAVNFVVLVTLDRYLMICHPLSVKRWCTFPRVRIMAIVTIIVSIGFNIPRFFDKVPVEYNNCTKFFEVGGYADYLKLNGEFYSMAYITVLYYTANVIIPIIVLLVLNSQIIAVLKRSSKFKRASSMKTTSTKEQKAVNNPKERMVTVMLCVVVVVFIVCQTPAFAISMVYTLYSFGVKMPDRSMMRYWYSIGITLVAFNSAINFVVYFAFSNQFRQVLISHLIRMKFYFKGPVAQSKTLEENMPMTTEVNETNGIDSNISPRGRV
ncbi:unnamed protein product, partial [Owenia fusiformis]